MSWWTDFREGVKHTIHKTGQVAEDIGKSLEKGINSYLDHGGYIGVNFRSNNDGKNWSIEPKIEPGINQGYGSKSSYAAATNGNAYSRSTAATGGDIKQGGMTKDDIIEFNQKHPNETAQVGG